MSQLRTLMILGFSAFFLDQITKYAAYGLGWTYSNASGPLGIFEDADLFYVGLIALAVAVVIWSYHVMGSDLGEMTGLTLVAAGVAGNLIDFAVHRAVWDWIPLPGTNIVFNIADVLIIFGLFVWIFLREPSKGGANEGTTQAQGDQAQEV